MVGEIQLRARTFDRAFLPSLRLVLLRTDCSTAAGASSSSSSPTRLSLRWRFVASSGDLERLDDAAGVVTAVETTVAAAGEVESGATAAVLLDWVELVTAVEVETAVGGAWRSP